MILKRTVLWTMLALGLPIFGATTALACETSSWIATDPSSGPPGSKITITGAGFEPGTVIFRWDRSAESGGEILGQATVGDEGDVIAEVTVPDATSGAHKVIAEHSSSSETVAHADAWSDFHIPGATADRGSETGSETGAEEAKGQASADSGATSSNEQSERAEPVGRPVEVTVAQPVAEAVPAADRSQSLKADDSGSGSHSPVSQLERRLRAVDVATYPVAMERLDEAVEVPSETPPRRETPAWDLRWIAAAVVAMVAGLLVQVRRKRRSPEPEAPVLAMSKAHGEEAETSRAA